MCKSKILLVLLSVSLLCNSCVILPTETVPITSNQTNSFFSTRNVNIGLLAIVGVFLSVTAYLYFDMFYNAGESQQEIERRRREREGQARNVRISRVKRGLENACKDGNFRRAKDILDFYNQLKDYEQSTVDFDRSKLFFCACEGGNVEIVRELMQNRMYRNFWATVNCAGDTILHAACRARSPEVFKFIVNEKIENINDVNNAWLNRKSPLHIACECGRGDLVRWLIEEEGADKEVEDKSVYKKKPIFFACKGGYTNMVKYLMNDAQVHVDWRVLAHASTSGNLELVQWLIEEKGLDPNGKKDLFEIEPEFQVATAIECALRAGKINVARWLMEEKGVALPNQEIVAMVASLIEGGGVETARFLIEKGVELNDYTKDRLISFACNENKLDLLQYILEAHPVDDLNRKDLSGNTYLHGACRNKHKEIVRYLLQKNVEVNIKNIFGETPLHRACSNDDSVIVKMLLDKGADVTIKDDHGHIPSSTKNKIKKLLEKKRR